MKTTEKNICESCGMPIGKISSFGSYEDGSVNTEYCRYCYQKGKFTNPGISMQQKIEKNINIAEKMGMPRAEAAKLAKATIPKLKRWKKSSKSYQTH